MFSSALNLRMTIADVDFLKNAKTYLGRPPKEYSAVIHKMRDTIKELRDMRFSVFFSWIPAHCGIHGNELADKAADKGRELVENVVNPQSPHYKKDFDKLMGIPFTIFKREITIKLDEVYQRMYTFGTA